MLTLIHLALAMATLQTPQTTPAPKADTYTLRWTPKAGDKLAYTTEADMTLNGAPSVIKSKSSEQVLKVDQDGTYSVQSSDEGTVIFSGQEFPMPNSIKVTLYRPNGEIVSISGEQVDPVSFRAANLTVLKRPDAPVAIGDSWAEDIKADPKSGAVAVHVTYKLDSVEKIGDVDALKIIAVSQEAEGAEAGSVNAVYWISKVDGSLVKYTGKWSNVTFAGSPTPLSGTLTMTRVAS